MNDIHRILKALKQISKDAEETVIRLAILVTLLIFLFRMIMHELGR